MDNSSTSCIGSRWKKALRQYGSICRDRRKNGSQRTLESCVEQETSSSNQQIADEGDEEDGVVPMSAAALDAFAGKVHEQEVCQRVDDLSGVYGGIIVLFAPVYSRGYWTPVRLFERRVRDRR